MSKALALATLLLGCTSARPAPVDGPGTLAGRARFVDGHPAPDLELWAVPEEVALLPNALAACVEQAAERERDGKGLFSAHARTDLDGRFAIAGLREGRYMLRCSRPTVVLEPRHGFYQTPTVNIALSVESSRLRVHALAGARVRLVELNEAAGGRYQAGQIWNETIGGPLGCASFDVQQETTYGLRIEAKGCAVYEDLVFLAQNEFEQVKEYRLEPQRPPGRVRLVLKSVGDLAPGPCEVDVLSPLTLAPDPEAEPLRPDAQGWLPPLAPGRYLFALRFRDPLSPYRSIETREVLELASEAEREIVLTLTLR